jgi:hypothetical protein
MPDDLIRRVKIVSNGTPQKTMVTIDDKMIPVMSVQWSIRANELAKVSIEFVATEVEMDVEADWNLYSD